MYRDSIEKCGDVLCAIYAEVGDDITKIVTGGSLAKECKTYLLDPSKVRQA